MRDSPTVRSALLVSALLLAACGERPPDTAEREPPPPAATVARGIPSAAAADSAAAEPGEPRDERVGELRVLHLRGTPEEMGRQMGELAGESIRYLVDGYLPLLPKVQTDHRSALELARRFAAGMPDDQRRELAATAAAAGVPEEHLLLASVIIEVVQSPACATVAAWGDATEQGEVIVGRNLDWFDFGKLHAHGVVVVRHPEQGRAFVSVGYPGLPGVLTGMNSDGLFVADMVLLAEQGPPADEGGIPVMALQRAVLERCADAGEAARLIETSPRTVPQNYLVADPTTALFLETDSAGVMVRLPVGETLAGTNWTGERRGATVGDLRFGKLCAALDRDAGRIDVAAVERALAAANAGPISVQSIVAVPARRLLRVSSGRVPAATGPFVDVDAGALMGGGR